MVKTMRALVPWALLLMYASYFVAGCGFLFAQSPALQGYLGMTLYWLWSILLFLSTTILFVGRVSKKEWIEVCGTLPGAAAAGVYAFSVIANPPYDQLALGIGASGLLGAHVWWLIARFLTLYPNLGSNDRRRNR